MSLPTLLLAPALAAVLLVVAWLLARLFREWRVRDPAGSSAKADEELALDLAKERVLLTLKDLEFDHEMGKISEEDYVDLKARYEAEAVAVIEQLDAL